MLAVALTAPTLKEVEVPMAEPEEDEPPPAPTESESAGMVLDMIIRNAVDWAALLDILDSLSTQTADVGTGKVAGGPRADEN